jgi:pimeloyl-ACP methyl ester carboxylesterase
MRLNDLAPTGEFIEIDGQRLHYRILGDDGPPVIGIHGASGNLLDWTAGVAPGMAETNRVLLFDRPGLGFSTRPANGSNPSVQAALMREAARQLGFERAILAGHSYGGAVALAWALDAPETVESLLLLAAPSQTWKTGPSLQNRIASNPVGGPILANLAAAFVPDSLIESNVAEVFAPQLPPENYAERINLRLTLQPAVIQANATDLVTLKSHINEMIPRYDALTMPVELLHGDADTTVGLEIHSRPLAARLPQARLEVLDGVGHMPHHVAQPAVLSALARLNAQYGG